MAWVESNGLRSTIVGEEASDLADLYHQISLRGELFGFEATERFYEIGTSTALAETSAFLSAHAQLG